MKRKIIGLASVLVLLLGIMIPTGLSLQATGENLIVNVTQRGKILESIRKAPGYTRDSAVKSLKIVMNTTGVWICDWRDTGYPEEIMMFINGTFMNTQFVCKFQHLEVLDLSEATLRPADNNAGENGADLPAGQLYGLMMNQTIKKLILPKNLKEIQNWGGPRDMPLLSVCQYPDSVVAYGPGNFVGCTSMTGNLRLPNNPALTKVPDGGFSQSYFSSITIPSCYNEIGHWAFRQLPLTGVVTIPANIKKLGEACFDESLWDSTALVMKSATAPTQLIATQGATNVSAFWIGGDVPSDPVINVGHIYLIVPKNNTGYNLTTKTSQWSKFKLPTISMTAKTFQAGSAVNMAPVITAGGAQSQVAVAYTYKGTGTTVYGPSSVAPKAAGTYSVTATISNVVAAVGKGTATATLTLKPIIAKAIAGVKSVKVSWGVVSGAAGYQVQRSTSATTGFVGIASVTTTSYNNISLSTGKTYYYKVRSYKFVSGKKQYGPYSDVVSAKAN